MKSKWTKKEGWVIVANPLIKSRICSRIIKESWYSYTKTSKKRFFMKWMQDSINCRKKQSWLTISVKCRTRSSTRGTSSVTNPCLVTRSTWASTFSNTLPTVNIWNSSTRRWLKITKLKLLQKLKLKLIFEWIKLKVWVTSNPFVGQTMTKYWMIFMKIKPKSEKNIAKICMSSKNASKRYSKWTTIKGNKSKSKCGLARKDRSLAATMMLS